jgi:hypothetical protein
MAGWSYTIYKQPWPWQPFDRSQCGASRHFLWFYNLEHQFDLSAVVQIWLAHMVTIRLDFLRINTFSGKHKYIRRENWGLLREHVFTVTRELGTLHGRDYEIPESRWSIVRGSSKDWSCWLSGSHIYLSLRCCSVSRRSSRHIERTSAAALPWRWPPSYFSPPWSFRRIDRSCNQWMSCFFLWRANLAFK